MLVRCARAPIRVWYCCAVVPSWAELAGRTSVASKDGVFFVFECVHLNEPNAPAGEGGKRKKKEKEKKRCDSFSLTRTLAATFARRSERSSRIRLNLSSLSWCFSVSRVFFASEHLAACSSTQSGSSDSVAAAPPPLPAVAWLPPPLVDCVNVPVTAMVMPPTQTSSTCQHVATSTSHYLTPKAVMAQPSCTVLHSSKHRTGKEYRCASQRQK